MFKLKFKKQPTNGAEKIRINVYFEIFQLLKFCTFASLLISLKKPTDNTEKIRIHV